MSKHKAAFSLQWDVCGQTYGDSKHLLAGHRVCKESWAHLLGVGKNRLRRCRHTFQGKDLRSVSGRGGYSLKLAVPPCFPNIQLRSQLAQWLISGPSARPSVMSASVTSFMVHLYWSAAEPMSTAQLGSKSYNQKYWIFVNQIHWELFSIKCAPKTFKDCFQCESSQGGRRVAEGVAGAAHRLPSSWRNYSNQFPIWPTAVGNERASSWILEQCVFVVPVVLQNPGSRSSFKINILWCVSTVAGMSPFSQEESTPGMWNMFKIEEQHPEYKGVSSKICHRLCVWRSFEGSYWFSNVQTYSISLFGNKLAWSGCPRTCSLVWCSTTPLHENLAGPPDLLLGPSTGQGSWGHFSFDHRLVW